MTDRGPKDEDSLPAERAHATASGGEDPRRHFLKVIGLGGLSAGLVAVVGAPAVAYVAYPLSHTTVSGGEGFLPVGDKSMFKPGKPVKVDVFADRTDAWNRVVQVKVGSAWIVNDDGKLRAYSTVCPHLGCAIDFEGDKFKCPCHRSAFTLEGAVQGGPAPRNMDELEVQIKEDTVAIRYQRFKQGVTEKELA